jgi:hypothetical protein
MPHPTTADLGELISTLGAAGVDFIVVGGAAAVLHGAPVTTVDLDIVPGQSGENVQRLLGVLRDIDARIRDPAGRDLRPDETLLRGTGQILLTTRLGPMDILCRLHDGRGYTELLPTSLEMHDEARRIRLLDLPELIAIKSTTGRSRDQLVVPVLLALLRRQKGEPPP